MNRWAAALAQSPPTLLRLIAATHRVALPRRCSPAERLARLRAALCRPAALRALYWALEPDAQAALQALRACPGGLRPDALTARFGPIRPLHQVRADPRPRSLSERLLLLGLLLPRPAAPFHPPRFLVPPEVRAWLPAPLPLAPPPPDPAASEPPVLAATTALLLAAAEGPLPARQDGRLTAAARRALVPRLAPLPPEAAAALLTWTVPLLLALGALARDGAALAPGPAAPRLLALPPAGRLARLRAAWEMDRRPEAWLVALRVRLRGLDAPALRRRLLVWAAHLPPEAAAQPERAYARLAAALGPLADGTTHSLSGPSRRGPWTARRAATVWAAACVGPLRWLGALPAGPQLEARDGAGDGGVSPRQEYGDPEERGGGRLEGPATLARHAPAGGHGRNGAAPVAVPGDPAQPGDAPAGGHRRNGAAPVAVPGDPQPGDAPAGGHGRNGVAPAPRAPAPPPPHLHTSTSPHLPTHPAPWTWSADGRLHLPRRADLPEALAVAAFGRWEASTPTTLVYRLGPAEVAAAIARGHDPARLATPLALRGGVPAALAGTLRAVEGLRLVRRTVLLSADPEDLARAVRRSRAARRALEAQVAPGVALVAPGRERALARALARAGRGVPAPPEERAARAGAPVALTPAERAGLLAAAAFYAAHAPPGAPPPPPAAALAKLRAGLPPALAAAGDRAEAGGDGVTLAGDGGDAGAPATAGMPPPRPAALGALRETLRRAVRRREAVRLWYQGARDAAPRERVVRPLRLEEHGPVSYLHAYCLAARAERCFRLDRVTGMAGAALRGAPGDDAGAAAAAPGRADDVAAPGARPRRPAAAGRAAAGRLALGAPPVGGVRVWLE